MKGKREVNFEQTFLIFGISSYKSTVDWYVALKWCKRILKAPSNNKSSSYYELKTLRKSAPERRALGKLLFELLFWLYFRMNHSKAWLLFGAKRLSGNISAQICLFFQQIWRDFDRLLGKNVGLWRRIDVFLVMVSLVITQRKWSITNVVVHHESHMRLLLVRCLKTREISSILTESQMRIDIRSFCICVLMIKFSFNFWFLWFGWIFWFVVKLTSTFVSASFFHLNIVVN